MLAALLANLTNVPPPPPPVVPTGVVGAGGYPDYCSPWERECKRKAREYTQRVALGILPKPEEPVIDLPVKVERFIEKKVEEKLPQRITVRFNQERVIEAVVKETLKAFYKERIERDRERAELEEEEDIAYIASTLH